MIVKYVPTRNRYHKFTFESKGFTAELYERCALPWLNNGTCSRDFADLVEAVRRQPVLNIGRMPSAMINEIRRMIMRG